MVICWQDWWWQHGLSALLGDMCQQLFMSMWSSKSRRMVLLWWVEAIFSGILLHINDLGSNELGFLAFCKARLSQGLEIHHDLYKYLSFPSCRSSVLYRARNICKLERKKLHSCSVRNLLFSLL